MVTKIFIEVEDKVRQHGKRKVIAAASFCCLVILITFFSTLLAGKSILVILGIFYVAVAIFIKLLELQNPLLTAWSRIWLFVHYGIMVGTAIIIIPLIKKVYERESNQTTTKN